LVAPRKVTFPITLELSTLFLVSQTWDISILISVGLAIIGIALIAVAARAMSASGGGGSYYDYYYSSPAATYGTTYLIPGISLFICGTIGIILTPELLIKRFGGKKWANQPWLFGIEGYCDIGEIEAKLFGTNEGHLKWDPFGSPLSRHEPNAYGEVQGVDPMSRADVREYVRKVRESGETRVSSSNGFMDGFD
jgi:hypothetical protein